MYVRASAVGRQGDRSVGRSLCPYLGRSVGR